MLALAAAVICILGTTQASSSDWVEKEATRETMQVIFDSLRYLLQIDLSDGDFNSAQNREKVLEALRGLDDQSARDMIDAAGKADFPSQRSALVEYIAASSLLHYAPRARQAYALLVEKINRTYMRSPGGRLPLDVEERLWELRQAIDGVRPPSAGFQVTSSDRLV